LAGTVAVVLAAGLGTRMNSDLVKVLHRVGGVPMVAHVVEAALGCGADAVVVVVGNQGERVRAALGGVRGVRFAVQAEQRGTGHAVLAARRAVGDAEHVVVLYGDAALVTPEVLRPLVDRHRSGTAAATLLTAELDDPAGYGRIVRGPDGRVLRIVEEADATPAERAIREWNTGIGAYRAELLWPALARLRADNAKGEFYLTDVVGLLVADGLAVEAVVTPHAELVEGVDDRADLARAEATLRERVIRRLFEEGVTVVDPASTWVDVRARIGRDTVIHPFTIIEGPCQVGPGCRLGPSARIVSSRLGAGVTVVQSTVEDAVVADGVEVGPYAHVRPGTRLEVGVRVGNFAEIKNSRIGPGSKVPHHSYVGDADVGAGVNVGAGVVTVNYDGLRKHRTVVADGAFLGCNANLVAPVTVGPGAFVAAGSTVTEDVPAGTLAIARARQVNKHGWAEGRLRGAGAAAGGRRGRRASRGGATDGVPAMAVDADAGMDPAGLRGMEEGSKR
jgi:bifunctional UDP-N-acetylglucosamine pyrophosphorylase/glucosamine-1-phosphate N-acetyltransferase